METVLAPAEKAQTSAPRFHIGQEVLYTPDKGCFKAIIEDSYGHNGVWRYTVRLMAGESLLTVMCNVEERQIQVPMPLGTRRFA